MLAAIPARWRPLYATAVYTGLRKGELAGLRWEDVDFARGLVRVARSYDQETKTGTVRYVPLCD
jgi:integrase